jgi:hypothetical protein
MQIGGESIGNLLRNMVLGKKNFKKTDLKICFFYASLLGNGLNKFQFGIVQLTTSKKDDLQTLKLSYLNRNQLQ